MLSFFDRVANPTRKSGWNRREFLRVGGLGLGGLSLANLLSTQAHANAKSPLTGKSVIFLFLHGGPSQTETFDPKMTAPAGVRSATGETSTSLPGITFGSTFTKLASHAHKLNIVRSYRTGDSRHDIKPIVHTATRDANLGSLYSRVAGTTHPSTGMPRNVALYPRAVDASTQPANMNFGKFGSTGALGSAYAPFVPGSGGAMQEAMQLSMPRERLDDRRLLLNRLDNVRRRFESDSANGLDRFQEQAFETILGGVADAFDLSNEDPSVVARYDTAPLVRPENISRRWNNYNNYVDNAKTLGKLLLLARRLCQRGCGFVTVTTNFVWDMHSDQNNAGVEEGMQYMGVPLDHVVSAFIEDLESSGLADDILLVVSGEMGRTPKINQRGGRDHWGNLSPLLLYGGGLPQGQVIGQSTKDAGEPLSEPLSIQHLLSTIMHTLLDVGEVRLMSSIPADVRRVITEGSPIPGLS